MSEAEIYQTISSRRSPTFKNMIKRLIILGAGAIAGLAIFSIGMAWVKNPNVMVWALWGAWIYGLAWSFSKVHFYKSQNDRLEDKVEELQSMIWDRYRPSPSIPIASSISTVDPEKNMEDIINDIERNLNGYTYFDLMSLKAQYPQSKKLQGLILNWAKFWTRHPERSKNKSRNALKA